MNAQEAARLFHQRLESLEGNYFSVSSNPTVRLINLDGWYSIGDLKLVIKAGEEYFKNVGLEQNASD